MLSSTETLNFRGGYIFGDLTQRILQHSNTILNSLDPGKMAWFAMALPHNLQTALASGVRTPAKHPQDLPGDAEVRRPRPDHREADTLEGLRQVQNQDNSSSIFCPCSSVKPFHFHHYFPHRSPSSPRFCRPRRPSQLFSSVATLLLLALTEPPTNVSTRPATQYVEASNSTLTLAR